MKNGRILVGDDEEIVHETIKRLLKTKGYSIDSAFSGEEILDKLHNDYDLLICDIRMPDIDGIEVLRQIREKKDLSVEVIMLTGFASLESATESVNYGARNYLLKPIENVIDFRNKVGEAVQIAQNTRVNKQLYDSFLLDQIDSFISYDNTKKIPKLYEKMKEIIEPFIQLINDGFIVTDIKGNISFLNISFAQMVGESFESILGAQFQSYISQDEQEKVEKIFSQQTQGQIVPNIQTHLITAFNNLLSVNISFIPILFQNEFEGIAIIISDMTEISYVRERVELFAKLVENTQYDLMFIVKPDGNIVECNSSARNTFGYSQNEILSRNIDDLIVSQDGIDWNKIMQSLRSDSNWLGEVTAVSKNNKEFSIEITVKRLRSKIGNKEYILCFMRDITERKQAETREELRKKQEFLDHLIKVTPIAILTLDFNGIITLANKNVTKLLGYENDELIGFPISKMIVNGVNLESDKNDFIIDFVKKDGQVNPMNISTSIIKENNQENIGMIVTLQDVSELRGLFITPSREDMIENETVQEFDLEPGFMYLIDNEEHTGFDVFLNLVKQGKSGLCITRQNPQKLKEMYGLSKTPIVWLTQNRISNQLSIDPTDLFKLKPTITNFIKEAKDGVILLDGLEYLILENDFISVIKTIEQINDLLMASSSSLLLEIDSDAFDTKDYHIMKRWMQPLPTAYKNKLK